MVQGGRQRGSYYEVGFYVISPCAKFELQNFGSEFFWVVVAKGTSLDLMILHRLCTRVLPFSAIISFIVYFLHLGFPL